MVPFRRGLVDSTAARGSRLPILLPTGRLDGNELRASVADVAVPLATTMNLRRPEAGGTLLVGLTGYWPLHRRVRTGADARSAPVIPNAMRRATIPAHYRDAAMALSTSYLLGRISAIMTDAAGRWLHATKK
jgi:hypothetical protein